MLVKLQTAFALALVLTLTPAAAAPYSLEVPGPCLVVLETASGDGLVLPDDPKKTFHLIVLDASPSHLVLAVDGPGVLGFDNPENAEVVATFTRVQITEHEIQRTGDGYAFERSFYPVAFETKEEDHDIDPAPKHGGLEPAWTNDWVLASTAIPELGSGWYFVVRSGEVTYEVVVERR